jgi:hypothetical protein
MKPVVQKPGRPKTREVFLEEVFKNCPRQSRTRILHRDAYGIRFAFFGANQQVSGPCSVPLIVSMALDHQIKHHLLQLHTVACDGPQALG